MASLVPSFLYWVCITLPRNFPPVVCPWHSMAMFVGCMLASIALGSVAAWKASRWWAIAAVLAIASLFMGGTTI